MLVTKAIVVSFDAGIRDKVSEFLRSQGYQVETLRFISQVNLEEEAVVFYHNRSFTVHHLMRAYLVLVKARLIFMGDFRGISIDHMVHVPFTFASLQRAIDTIA